MEFIVGLLFAIICYLLAEEKNRSKVAWAILGFLFNVWAFLILAFLNEKDER